MTRVGFVFALLLGAVGNSTAWGDLPGDAPLASTTQVELTVDRAIQYLQRESEDWLNTRQCAACHHVALPLWALGEAKKHGYDVDQKFIDDTIDSMFGSPDKVLTTGLFPQPGAAPDPRPQARGLNVGIPFLAVAAQSLPSLTAQQQEMLKPFIDEIVNKQQPDGSWEFFPTLRRPPVNETQSTDAAWIIMALAGEAGQEVHDARRMALSKGHTWMDSQPPSNLHQDKVLKVWIGSQLGHPRDAMQNLVSELLALQRADGGWSQTVPEPLSDAFATGQTLYVLSLAGCSSATPEIQRGVKFLVAAQDPDGSWPMISRSTPDGSPGSATLLTPITCAASSWATLALSRLAHHGN